MLCPVYCSLCSSVYFGTDLGIGRVDDPHAARDGLGRGEDGVAVAGGFLLAGLQMFHAILDSLLIFGAIHAGVQVDYPDWLGGFGYTLLFNMLGGLLLVTALRLLRIKDLVEEHRENAPGNPDAAR